MIPKPDISERNNKCIQVRNASHVYGNESLKEISLKVHPDLRGWLTGDIYQGGKLLVKYCLGSIGAGKTDMSVGRSTYESLLQKGKDVVYYGDSIDPQDSNSLLMQWKLDDGRYKVIFGDLCEREVSAEELVKLQAEMLQRKAK